ncbi:gamma-glutamyltransferase [Sphingosinicella rhizophila]|uniref:Glutathione hydrolase proenzyme n=1 Tax=Sphingosinicella rhizophila TaxID=3050082 RepID=A0ABU3Q7V8_9SPHN|nr:gamma-glutamyltransferase [Sphingosinicella sp. GR2756]MDT9599489.1 gamma-glutamyltransferase [Sphingosinicella sp. GR2756]
MPHPLRRVLRSLHFLFPLMLLAGCASPAVHAPPALSGPPGMVSAADPRAAAAGVEILNTGGSAADAAVAVMLALTVVEPQSSGIGGGSFLVYHDEKSGRILSYDGREAAPAAATAAYFLDDDGTARPRRDAVPGGMSVGVPGNLRLAELAHDRHGQLPWARLFEPAIRLAREGFAITPRMHRSLAANSDLAAMTPWARSHFFDPDGQPKAVGTLLTNPDLAHFLEKMAARGPDYFYTGPAAEALVRTVRGAARNPSSMTTGDLASYDAKERQPLCGAYRVYRVCGMGPPSSGATTVFAILKQLERFDLAALGPDDPRAWHLIAESMRLAYADREAYLGDPDFVRVPAPGLMGSSYLAGRSRLISPGRTMAKVAAGTPPGAARVTAAADHEVPSTSHVVAADAGGNVATLTTTIEGPWGSGLTVNGFFLNNELTDFSFAPEENGAPVANRVEGGKRPRSSMSPTIVYGPDGEVRIAIGAAGGITIIAQVAKALIGVLDWNLSAQDAIALPVILGIGDRVAVEKGTKLELMMPALAALGQQVSAIEPGFKANAIEYVDGHWRGAADPRSEGVAISQ